MLTTRTGCRRWCAMSAAGWFCLALPLVCHPSGRVFAAWADDPPPFVAGKYQPLGPRVQSILKIPDGPNEWLGELRASTLPMRDKKRLGKNWFEPSIQLSAAEREAIGDLAARVVRGGRASELADAMMATYRVPEYFGDRRKPSADEGVGLHALAYVMMIEARNCQGRDPAGAAQLARAAAFLSASNPMHGDGDYLSLIGDFIRNDPAMHQLLGLSKKDLKDLEALFSEIRDRNTLGAYGSPLLKTLAQLGDTLMLGYQDRSISDEQFEVCLKCFRDGWVGTTMETETPYFYKYQMAVAGWTLKCFFEVRKDTAKVQRVRELLGEMARTHARNAHERRWLQEAAEAPGPDPRHPAFGIILDGPSSPFLRKLRPD